MLARTLSRSTALGVLAGLGLGLAPAAGRSGRTPRPTRCTSRSRRSCCACSSAGRTEPELATRTTRRADRWLIASAFVFALSVGNHSLTLLLAPPVALFVFAVDPAHPAAARAWSRRCAAVLAVTLVLLYLELPLAGRSVPGAPRLRTARDLGRLLVRRPGRAVPGQRRRPVRGPGWQGRAARRRGRPASSGRSTPLIPLGFLATVVRRPRYALLTGSAAALTCFFAASYVNADIGRYYLVPWLFAWTWLAVLGAFIAVVVANLADRDPRPPGRRHRPARFRRVGHGRRGRVRRPARGPTVVAIPGRYRVVEREPGRSRRGAGWTGRWSSWRRTRSS